MQKQKNGKLIAKLVNEHVYIGETNDFDLIISSQGHGYQSRAMQPEFIMYFPWGEGKDDFCLIENAPNIIVDALSDINWIVNWKEDGYWYAVSESEIDSSADFQVKFHFGMAKTNGLKGDPVLMLKANFGEDEEGNPDERNGEYPNYVHKSYPIKLEQFTIKPMYVKTGEDVTVEWRVENAVSCFLCDKEKPLFGKETFTVTQTQKLTLRAQNQLGREMSDSRKVTVTGWSMIAQDEQPLLQEQDSSSALNRHIVQSGGYCWIFQNNNLYRSTDGRAWEQVYAKIHEDMVNNRNYIPIIYNNTLHLSGGSSSVGQERLGTDYVINLSNDTMEWALKEKKTFACGTHATSTCKLKNLYCVSDANIGIVMHQTRKDDFLWSAEFVLDGINAQTFEIAERDDVFYLATKNDDAKKINLYIIESKMGQRSVRPVATNTVETGSWFRLINCDNIIYLLTPDGLHRLECQRWKRVDVNSPKTLKKGSIPFVGVKDNTIMVLSFLAAKMEAWVYTPDPYSTNIISPTGEAKKRLMEETLREKGTKHLNLSNYNHFGVVMDMLGGEEQMKKKSEELYQSFKNTAKKQANTPEFGQLYHAGKVGPYLDGGGEDTKLLYMWKKDGLYGYVRCSFLHKRTAISVYVELIDCNNPGNIIANSSFMDSNSFGFSKTFKICDKSEFKNKGKRYMIAGLCSSVVELDGLAYCVPFMTAIDFVDITDIISSMNILAPVRNSSHQTNTSVKIGLNRDSSTFDYHYLEVTIDDKYFNIHLPCKGSVVSNYELNDKMDNDDIGMFLVNHKTGDQIEPSKETEEWKNFKFQFSSDKKTVSWEFPAQWMNRYPCEGMTATQGLALQFVVSIRVWPKGSVNPAWAIADSSSEGIEKPKLMPISYYWGCFGRDSMILISDGVEKKISSIKVGDDVKTTDAMVKRVKDIVTGYEENLVCIKTKGGRELLVTKTHPIATQRGVVQAINLNAADKVFTIHGTEQLTGLYLVPYNDTVYSLVFEDRTFFYADSIKVGDFMIQQECEQSPSPDKNPKRTSNLGLILQSQWNKLLKRLEQK